MAVYTQISAELLESFLQRYDAGALRSFKGIAEGVENSNFLVETERARFILTLYEKRVNPDDLPFFMALLDHLADKGLNVPRALPDCEGKQIQQLAGRPACLIEFLEGISPGSPNASQALATGEALGQMHRALADFDGQRPNSMGPDEWTRLLQSCNPHWDKTPLGAENGAKLDDICAQILDQWPSQLPHSVIHADLFPDNVLMLGNRVSGLIDFYFSCSDIRAYDLAVTHVAWCFDAQGETFNPDVSQALLQGYQNAHGLDDAERAALPVLAAGAALRFTLSRAYDWINTPADALVTRKNPLDFFKRLAFYTADENRNIFHG